MSEERLFEVFVLVTYPTPTVRVYMYSMSIELRTVVPHCTDIYEHWPPVRCRHGDAAAEGDPEAGDGRPEPVAVALLGSYETHTHRTHTVKGHTGRPIGCMALSAQPFLYTSTVQYSTILSLIVFPSDVVERSEMHTLRYLR